MRYIFRAKDDDVDKRPLYELTEQQQMCIEDVQASIREFRRWKQEQELTSELEATLEQEPISELDAIPEPTPEPTLEPTLEPPSEPEPSSEPQPSQEHRQNCRQIG